MLTLLYRAGSARGITQVLQVLMTRLGLTVGGQNPAKTISDVLRYEVRRGRVQRR